MCSKIENHHDEFTTDAVPSPSPTVNKKYPGEDEVVCEDADNEINFDEDIGSGLKKVNNRRTKHQGSGYTKIRRPFQVSRQATAQATIININNSVGIHVGDEIVYNINRSENSSHRPDVAETDAIKSLKVNTDKLTREDLLFVSTHMNDTWQNLARALNFSDGQIEQFIRNHHLSGIKEVIYQMLLDWTQYLPNEASIGNLCNILWETNQKDVVKRWSERKQ